jgi:hypothetical protein
VICFGGSGLVIGAIGALNFCFARHRDYHFRAKEMLLQVRGRNGDSTIPFARIVKAVVVDDGSESIGYALKLNLRDPVEELDLTQHLHNYDTELKQLADKINRFLRFHKDEPEEVSIDLADTDLATATKTILTNLWYGTPDKPPDAATQEAVKPSPAVMRDGDVLFVCPECGFQTTDPGDKPPYECDRCRRTGTMVLLQDRTPGRALVVACACGATFSVPLSFAGTKRPCPKCGQKCSVPNARTDASTRTSKPINTSDRDEDF